MAQLVLENFKYGLEYRRSELTANPGALFDALNCFVNEGGEVERRKAWFPLMSANSGLGLMPPTGPNWAWEFEYAGAVLIGESYLTIQPSTFLQFPAAGTIPGVLGTSPATTDVAFHIFCLLHDSQSGIFDLSGNGFSNVVTITSKFGYNVTVTTLVNNSGTGIITYTNNGTSVVLITVTGTWNTGDHIKFSVAQTNCTLTIGYGVGPISTYPAFTTQSIFGGGTTVPTSFMQLSEPISSTATITEITTTTFAGKVFCIAKWSTGRTYEYYQGAVLADCLGAGIYAGLIGATTTATNNNIASYLATIITAYGTALPAPGPLIASAVNNVVTITCGGSNIAVNSTENSTLGICTIGGNGTATVTLTIIGTWLEGDRFTVLTFNVAAVGAIDISAGVLAGLTPTFCYTFGTKVYLLERTSTYYSAVNSATDFHTSASGAGNIDLSKQDAIYDVLVTCCAYQGNLAFFFRHSIQIWNMTANDLLDARVQAMGNIGAVGKYAICQLGDLDVVFVDDSGICSLRPRDASSNAIPNDIGAPINVQVRAQLNAKTCLFSRICLGYDPTERKLFVCIPYTDNGYSQAYYQCTQACWCLSYFPQSKLIAWTAVDNKWMNAVGALGVQTQFWPQKFITWKGGLYFDGSANRYDSVTGLSQNTCLGVYGPWRVLRGTYTNSFDNAQAYFITPYLAAKSPGVRKHSEGVDIIVSGGWTIAACMSPAAGTFTDIATVGSAGTFDVVNSSTPDGPGLGFDASGNHVQFKGTGTIASVVNDLGLLTTTPGQQIFSQLIWYYDAGGAKD